MSRTFFVCAARRILGNLCRFERPVLIPAEEGGRPCPALREREEESGSVAWGSLLRFTYPPEVLT